MWERFSFYGIRPLLILFMAATVYDGGMGLARENASAIVGSLPGPCILPHCPAAGWRITGSGNKGGLVRLDSDRPRPSLHRAVGGDGDSLFFIGLMFIVLGSGLFKPVFR